MAEGKLTPMMQQYYEIKAKYPDFVLFFRLGDFYEMFDDDAEEAAKILDITLTKRNNQRMCGIPYHAADNYIHKVIKAGKKVAMCEQVEEPGKNKIVKREVVEIITPGTFTDDRHLNKNQDSFLVSIEVQDKKMAISACDASTGKFWVLEEERDLSKLASILQILKPSEIICSRIPSDLENVIKKYYYTLIPDYYYSPPLNEVLLLEHFKVGTLKGIGLHSELLAGVTGSILRYLRDNLFQEIKHLNGLRFIRSDSYVYLPESTIKNVEILEPLFTNQEDTSLFAHFNETLTSMGARELRNWLIYPLLEKEAINHRLDQVQFFTENSLVLDEVRKMLKHIPDLERMLSKISLGKTHPKEINSFKEGLKVIEEIKKIKNLPFDELPYLEILMDIIEKIEQTIEEEPPINFEDGGVIKKGVDETLDEYKKIATKGKEFLFEIEEREREKTGIKKLRLRYNKVIGYYLEVSKANSNLVPDYFIRKQSLVGSERYTINELVEFETKILDSKSKLVEYEKKIFKELILSIVDSIKNIKENIDFIKKLDITTCLGFLAEKHRYVRPKIRDDLKIIIEEGKHPVVESFVEQFTPNSIKLNDKDHRLLLITGPNMAGKSTYLRQVALITLLAHVGSFVPAKKAEIGITDQIHTRIGASDNLAGGESTFLVEMSETSQILRSASPRSLIIMDEVGRGTSTYDGLSLAWAIVEYLNDSEFNRGRTLFATHYHELTVLGQEKGIKNYRMAVKEWNEEIIFLHKVEEGAADKSYGIHVAEIAGIPNHVIKRAVDILSSMEISLLNNEKKLLGSAGKKDDSLFQVKIDPFEKVKSKILSIDINHTTPIQALLTLEELQKDIRKGK